MKVTGVLLGFSALILWGCRQDMHDMPRYEPLEASKAFADGRSARELPEGVIYFGKLEKEKLEKSVDENGNFLTNPPQPIKVDREFLERGMERYNIYCSPCHGRLGDGLGMVVRRGFKRPASFHEDRLKQQPVGYFFDVITNGFGLMSSYKKMIPVEDRWAIATFVKVLQFSQNVPYELLTEEEKKSLDTQGGG